MLHTKLISRMIFSGGTLFIGLLTAYLSFKFFPSGSSYNLPALYPPQFAFWLVWIVIYPAMGAAASCVWDRRHEADIRGAMVFFVSLMIGNLFFLPISNLSGGNPAVMTLLDLNGVFASVLLGWIFSRYSRAAFYWLLPLIVWMPITLLFKINLWIHNPVIL